MLALLDVALILAAMGVAYTARTASFTQPFWASIGAPTAPFVVPIGSVLLATLVYQVFALPFVMYAFGWYAPDASEKGRRVFSRVGIATILVQYPLLGLLYLLDFGYVPRALMVVDFTLVALALPAWRLWWSKAEAKRMAAGEHLRNVLIIGGTGTSQMVAHEIIRDPYHGMRIVGFLADAPIRWDHIPADVLSRADVWAPTEKERVEVVGEAVPSRVSLKAAVTTNAREQPRHLLSAVGGYSPEEVSVALDGLLAEEVYISGDLPHNVVDTVVRACRERGVDVHLVPPQYPELGAQPAPWTLGPFTMVSMYRQPFSKGAYAAKRALDIVGGTLGLLATSPILLATAIAIKLEDPKLKVFYWSTRTGLKGRHFRMLKFTTMVPDAQKYEPELKRLNKREGPWFKVEANADPRLTKVGRIVRKYSINEIPQLWNIVKGDMSLVGPRPPLPEEVADYVEYDFRYYRCLDVKPGLTGLWQVMGRTDPSFEKRIDMDLQYIREWTFWLDLKLIAMTPVVILTQTED